MADQEVEFEICGNCKREIPQSNYVMHTAHCARNITLCQVCKEPVSNLAVKEHARNCIKQTLQRGQSPPKQKTPVAQKTFKKSKTPPKQKTPEPPKTNIEKSSYYQARQGIQIKQLEDRRERFLERHEKIYADSSGKTLGSYANVARSVKVDRLGNGTTSNITSNGITSNVTSNRTSSNVTSNSSTTDLTSNGTTSKVDLNGTGAIRKDDTKTTNGIGFVPKPSSGLMPCRYCDLDLPKMELEDHENYCGSRTDKCLQCGELVMYKNKQVHLDTNHGFLKMNDEPGAKPSWDSTTQRTNSPPRTRRVFSPAIYTDFSQFDPTDYLPSNYRIPKPKIEKGESSKEISRRLDCKTEYIRNLLHDSASITVPLRHSGVAPRNHFNHDKGPSLPSRRKNPPSELCIPCEFCDTPIPHMDLVQHETGCRPDLFTSRARSRNFEFDDDFEARAPSPVEEPKKKMPQPEVSKPSRRKGQSIDNVIQLPCEFCHELIPGDDLIRHQTGCRPDLAQFGGFERAEACTPEVQLPCEFCDDMIPASQLFRHQATCG